MNDEMKTLTVRSYPLRIERKIGPPTVLVKDFPPLPGENYVEYGARVSAFLAQQRLARLDASPPPRCGLRTFAFGVVAIILALLGFAMLAASNL